MLIQPIDYFLVVWFTLAAGSTAYVAWDQYRNNPEPAVMKWGFILVTLYMGPIGLLLYVLADKDPRPGSRGVTHAKAEALEASLGFSEVHLPLYTSPFAVNAKLR